MMFLQVFSCGDINFLVTKKKVRLLRKYNTSPFRKISFCKNKLCFQFSSSLKYEQLFLLLENMCLVNFPWIFKLPNVYLYNPINGNVFYCW